MALNPTSSRGRPHGPSLTTRARRTLVWLLLIFIALAGLNWLAVSKGGQWTPKLALDLEGGTQMVLQAQLPEGHAEPTSEQLQQAVSIIRQRVDAAGVSESEITTQGGRNIVVSMPGQIDDATRARIENSARLDFRPVIFSTQAAQAQAAPPDQVKDLPDTPTASPTSPSDVNQVSPKQAAQFGSFDCAKDVPNSASAVAEKSITTCDPRGLEKFVLGPVEVSGEHIVDASSSMVQTSQGASTGQWAVNIQFDAEGTQQFAETTKRLLTLKNAQSQLGDQSRFAVTVDNRVIVAPSVNAAIVDGKAQITGNFTQETAKALADQLKFGALPFTFQPMSTSSISATLGSSQLVNGLIAGAIGLLLVVVYSLFQYRALGLVTIASLVISAALTYLVVTFLSSQEGYRLSLAGVAGLIVAIGITADSFIVYFERIRDELRDGRGMVSAVEVGWSRAIRTIAVSDAVNLLVAGVLFFVAVGNVRGFALTLFLTTVIDLIVVIFFTHPVMRLLATTRFFREGHPASGLGGKELGAVYRGRGEFRGPAKRGTGAASADAAQPTLAERKAGRTLAELEASDDELKDATASVDTETEARVEAASTESTRSANSEEEQR